VQECIEKDCEYPDFGGLWPDSSVRCLIDYEELGCITKDPDDEVGKDGSKYFDKTCMKWKSSKPCRGGLPFYRMHSDAMSPGLCMEFCMGKGFDIAGIADGEECRCGASVLNSASWHMTKPRPGLTMAGMPKHLPEEQCHIHVFRYLGQFEMGGIPSAVAIGLMEQDVTYIDSIVKGKEIEEESLEDGIMNGIGHPFEQGTSKVPVGKKGKPNWNRPCYPKNCGPGDGLWPRREKEARSGVKDIWQEYVTVKYRFNKNIDRVRRELIRVAAEKWRIVTCMNFVEDSKDYDIRITKNEDGCHVIGLGYNPDSKNIVNLGWCNSMRFLGNVIHELGHVVGLNHEQERADAVRKYHGKGPHMKVKWHNLEGPWKYQFMPDNKAYTGSADDGEGDPHVGYSDYDFGSIMHYPARNFFDTIPKSARRMTGQRSRLSIGDILQVNDMYQCKTKNGEVPKWPESKSDGRRRRARKKSTRRRRRRRRRSKSKSRRRRRSRPGKDSDMPDSDMPEEEPGGDNEDNDEGNNEGNNEAGNDEAGNDEDNDDDNVRPGPVQQPRPRPAPARPPPDTRRRRSVRPGPVQQPRPRPAPARPAPRPPPYIPIQSRRRKGFGRAGKPGRQGKPGRIGKIGRPGKNKR